MLDARLTAPFILGPSPREAPVSVLLLHGFTGSPWEVRPFGQSLADRGFHVHAPLLPGHGSTPEAMLWVTWREWLAAAEAGLNELRNAKRVVVAGLSMGALLSVILAERYAPSIHGLVLMAPVQRLKGWDATLLTGLRKAGMLAGIKERWLQKTTTDIEDDVARSESPILPRYPLTRVLDLMVLQDLSAEAAPRVKTPALIVAAENDHVIDPRGVTWLHKKLERSKLLWLRRGFHILPRDVDRARLNAEAAEFIDTLT